jgi:hypothetical protein
MSRSNEKLVKRLTAEVDGNKKLLEEAADVIERLQAERDELVELIAELVCEIDQPENSTVH